MGFVILNESLEQIKLLDKYESLIWTDRFKECGDFEIYTPVSEEFISLLIQEGEKYIWSSMSDHFMVLEQYEIKSSYDQGTNIIVTGRSGESILNRRIIAGHVIFENRPLEDAVEELITGNIINPIDANRKIPNFEFLRHNDPNDRISKMTLTAEYNGDNLYDAIVDICEEKDIGFRVRLSDRDTFVFDLYSGEDHSYNQTTNPYVIFSSDFQNLGASNYKSSVTDYRNMVFVEKPSSGSEPSGEYFTYPKSDTVKGIRRREVVGNDNLTSDHEVGEDSPEVQDIGKQTLKENKREELFEGQIDASNMFVYGTDFRIGDVVQIQNEYGIGAASRVSEIVINQDQDTYEIYPTFESIEKEDS